LRFFLAMVVIFDHSFQTSGLAREPLTVRTGVETGQLSVFCFFILSGFLIARSYVNISSLGRFLWHRCLRIFPGYWMCLLVVAFVVTPTLFYLGSPTGSLCGFLSIEHDSPVRFVTSNFFLVQNQFSIGELLQQAPQPCCLDGSLWSLPYEFYCYLLIAALGVAGLCTRRKGLGRFVVVAFIVVAWLRYHYPSALPWPGWIRTNLIAFDLAVWFCTGTLAYLYAEHIPLHPGPFVVSIIGIVIALWTRSIHEWGAIPVAYVVFCLAAWLPLSWWDKRGDFSYGLYIYSFPLQQLLAALRVQRAGLAVFIAASCALSLVAAVLSYWLVEKPALAWKNVRFGRA
jgi:peptidoglycan/LPS O-acetylase OafA/YrhL